MIGQFRQLQFIFGKLEEVMKLSSGVGHWFRLLRRKFVRAHVGDIFFENQVHLNFSCTQLCGKKSKTFFLLCNIL